MEENKQPFDIEKDPRYLELLDEESFSLHKISYEFLIRQYWHDSEKSFKVKFSAQHRYFIEKLEEYKRAFQFEQDEGDRMQNEINQLTATLAERDKEIEQFIIARRKQDEYYASEEVRHSKELSEAKATIEDQKHTLENDVIVIEKLKQEIHSLNHQLNLNR